MKKNIALVLSSGGARGIAHIGVINELEKAGYHITSLAGTSMGALVGGMYAMGKLPEFSSWLCNIDKRTVFALLDFTMSSLGVIKGERLFNELRKIVPDCDIASLRIPYCAIATDIMNNQEVVFREGSLYNAIRASVSIPTLVTPFHCGENILVDGGLINPLPSTRVIRNPHDLLVTVNVNSCIPCELPQKITEDHQEILGKYQKYFIPINKKQEEKHQNNNHTGYIDLVSRCLNLMVSRISELTNELYKPDLEINISKDNFGIYDFHKAEVIIEAGAIAARKALASSRLSVSL